MSHIERQPAEWAPHDAVWIGFPSHEKLWEDDLVPAQAEVAAFAEAVHSNGSGEKVVLVAADQTAANDARGLISAGVGVEIEPFGDIWLRDTGPIIVSNGMSRSARAFIFNGWGGKYRLEGDDEDCRAAPVRCAEPSGRFRVPPDREWWRRTSADARPIA